MIDRFVETADDFHREDEVEILGLPIVLGRGDGRRIELSHARATADFDLRVFERRQGLRQKAFGARRVHEQRLECIAHARPLNF